MTTLETRRIRGDLIEVFKILKGMEDVKKEKFFTKEKGCTRVHELKVVKSNCHLDCRKYAFSNKVINMWNILPSDVIACNTVYSFKHEIDAFLATQGFI
jgi:ribonuclease P/MRP protein subunit RPP40